MRDTDRLPDYYAVLGVDPEAPPEAIKQAFRQRALECHPDRVAESEKEGAMEEFVRVREAFDVLSDPTSRQRYDAERQRQARRRRRQRTSRPRSRRRHQRQDEDDRPRPRRRSYANSWRQAQNDGVVWMSRSMAQIDGLSNEHRIMHRHHRQTVPIGSLVGALWFVVEPTIMYGTDLFLVDMLLCAVAGGTYGFAVGILWGIVDLIRYRSR
jgi:hypothetical protein